MTMGARRARSQAALTSEERRRLVTFLGGKAVKDCAKILNVGTETVVALLDPCGRVSPETIDRVRSKLGGERS